jgi:hypothetical protein
MTDLTTYTVPSGKVLVLRTCHMDMVSSRGFVWPEAGGLAECSDWNPEPICGYGLHGWLWAVGRVQGTGAEYGFTEEGAKWLVLEVDSADVVEIDQKVKFPRAHILLVSDVKTCVEFIAI